MKQDSFQNLSAQIVLEIRTQNSNSYKNLNNKKLVPFILGGPMDLKLEL